MAESVVETLATSRTSQSTMQIDILAVAQMAT